MIRTVILSLAAIAMLNAQPYTRGVGVYPGDPKEDFAPVIVPETESYRNLALYRPAYHSSSYDYNLTAQLVTDGIKTTAMPRWLSTTVSQTGIARKNEREYLVDHNLLSGITLSGPRPWVQFELGGGDAPFEISRIDIEGRVQWNNQQPPGWRCTISGSDDGQTWKELSAASGTDRPQRLFRASIAFHAARFRFYRLDLDSPGANTWFLGEVSFFNQNGRIEPGGPYHFTSAWMGEWKNEEWVSVDLGAVSTIDRVVLYWIRRPAEGSVQASDDGANWQTVRTLPPSAGGLTDDIQLEKPARGRFVRVAMGRPGSPDGYVLSELEAYGTGGLVPQAKPAPAPGNLNQPGARMMLAGGAWKLRRDSDVNADGATLSKPGFEDKNWLVATVPATVLSSYWNAGALPDPNFGENQLTISDSYFYADFWYRDEFVVPQVAAGRRLWLNFDGVNWKAEVYLNGEKLGRIEGGFLRGRFDVTGKLRPGARNALAVRVEKNATPGSVKEKTLESPDRNGGALGADNPTYHASIGWDWIPTVRGRNTGIWGDVYIDASGAVTLDDPFVKTTLPLPDTSTADVSVEVTLRNHTARPVTGTLRGKFGDAAFSTPVTLKASETQMVKLDPTTVPALRLRNPKLWWPAGYGEPNLYPVDLAFEAGAAGAAVVSDSTRFLAGVRQFTTSEAGGALKMWINGRRFIPRGGNWGFPESMLRYRAREYDVAVRYHKEMNFTMIRNWVGQTPDRAFFEACDRHGIVVWQDFWLANPVDGPNPDDNTLFLSNARDFIRKIRNHPSIGLYCGRNEGRPPKLLDDGLRAALAELHPGLHYISSSADDVVSGHGPYRAMAQKFYFEQRATPKLHSELGMPNIVTLDSLKQMMPESALWPQGRAWALHDFCLNGAQGLASFRDMVEKSYGGANSAADFTNISQFINYNGYRAMYEAQSRNRMGLLIWMSHPSWPSFVWQTYDYYFEPTAAYFGAKKASEPLHIQWNAATNTVEVVNYSVPKAGSLTAKAEILNLDGTVQWERTATLEVPEDSTQSPIRLEFPGGISAVHFIRLKLMRGAETISENFYWRGTEEENYKALRTLPKVDLKAATRTERRGGRWLLTTDLENPSSHPALMVRLKAVREKSGDRILPAVYSDNYVALMPGERRTIRTELEHADTRGEAPKIEVSGFNIR